MGNCLKCIIKSSKKATEILSTNEWEERWLHQNIRNSYHAFSILCFYLELINKVSPTLHSLDEIDDQSSHAGSFNILSNAIYFLDKNSPVNQAQGFFHLALFISKLLHNLGLTPELNNCIHDGSNLSTERPLNFDIQHGGFSNTDRSEHDYRDIFNLLHRSFDKNYLTFEVLENISKRSLRSLFDFLCFQIDSSINNFQTKDLLI